jgi:hypothetical protein
MIRFGLVTNLWALSGKEASCSTWAVLRLAKYGYTSLNDMGYVLINESLGDFVVRTS